MAARILGCAFLAFAAVAEGDPASVTAAYFTVHTQREAQVILGVGFEIQSDSIGSANHGLPTVNTSVPNDLIPSERDRFYSDMLAGFRYCRLALGLYFRGTTPDQKNIVERWPGQAAQLAEMATKSGIEGFAVEYWSPPPGWKSNSNYIGGRLSGFDDSTLSSFGDAVVRDAQYLESQGLPVVWWGLQNEPVVESVPYSCCLYNASQYYSTFNATARKIRAALPHATIHASSWSGQYYAPQISADSETLGLVDVWTFHHVGADSNDQIVNQKYFLEGAAGKPVMNNEFEYLDDKATPERSINTAQSLINWMVFEDSPVWYWLHALKPLGHAEAPGYALGYWQPWLNASDGAAAQAAAGHAARDASIPPGTWEFFPTNWNSLAGFTRYLPWDSVRVNVTEDEVRPDVRVMAYRFNPAKARWLPVGSTAGERAWSTADAFFRVPQRPAPGSTARILRGDDAAERAQATKLAVVLTNRFNSALVQAVVSWDGIDELRGAPAPLPTFSGHLFQPNATDVPLGTVQAQVNASTGLPFFTATLAPFSIQFWVEE